MNFITSNKEFFNSKTFKITAGVIVGLIIILGIFRLGMSFGFTRATFNCQWDKNYGRNFLGMNERDGMWQDMGRQLPFGAHGVFGPILKVNATDLSIADRDGLEKIILVSDKTSIKDMRDDVKLSDLKIGDNVAVFGQPNDKGQIEASLIRITPPLPTSVKGNRVPPIETMGQPIR